MQPFFGALIARFILTTSVLALALAALVIVAAFADGQLPATARLIRVAFGAAPALAAVWVLLDLRRSQEDVGCAALGLRPVHLGTVLTLCAAPVLAFDTPVEPVGIHTEGATLHAPNLEIEWRDGEAWRLGDSTPFVGLPIPGNMPSGAPSNVGSLVLRLAVLWLGLFVMLRLDRSRGLPAGLALAAAVFWIGA